MRKDNRRRRSCLLLLSNNDQRDTPFLTPHDCAKTTIEWRRIMVVFAPPKGALTYYERFFSKKIRKHRLLNSPLSSKEDWWDAGLGWSCS